MTKGCAKHSAQPLQLKCHVAQHMDPQFFVSHLISLLPCSTSRIFYVVKPPLA